MIQYNIFPEGKKRILTFSYDDGHDTDIRLIELLNKYNMKGTFHLNSGIYGELTPEKCEKIRERYAGHEISCHTVSHGWPHQLHNASFVNEVLHDRLNLEKIANYPVVGMSYPFGEFDDEIIKMMSSCGIVYSRTVSSTNNFKLPTNFMAWHPTCHHNGMSNHTKSFLKTLDSPWFAPLYYVWGHSFDFKTEEQWLEFEENLKELSNNDKIWYATNIEIYNYMMAQRRLVISADENIIYNPSNITVYVEKNKSKIIKIEAGQTYYDN